MWWLLVGIHVKDCIHPSLGVQEMTCTSLKLLVSSLWWFIQASWSTRNIEPIFQVHQSLVEHSMQAIWGPCTFGSRTVQVNWWWKLPRHGDRNIWEYLWEDPIVFWCYKLPGAGHLLWGYKKHIKRLNWLIFSRGLWGQVTITDIGAGTSKKNFLGLRKTTPKFWSKNSHVADINFGIRPTNPFLLHGNCFSKYPKVFPK